MSQEPAVSPRRHHRRFVLLFAVLVALVGLAPVSVPVALAGGPPADVAVAEHAIRRPGLPDDLPVRQGEPELTITKTNNVSGSIAPGGTWIWTVVVTNTGSGTASFTNGTRIFTDEVPNTGVAYSLDSVTTNNVSASFLACSSATNSNSFTFSCEAFGGTVSIPNGGSITVGLRATASAVTSFPNPRSGGVCAVDPGNAIVELSEANNTCSDIVSVGPDLVVTKTNDTGGTAAIGEPWTWTWVVRNQGGTPVTFTGGQRFLLDHLPTTGLIYGVPSATGSAGVTGSQFCLISPIAPDPTALICAGFGVTGVTIPPNESITITLGVAPDTTGTYVNPRDGGVCQADPSGLIAETFENNNGCTNTVVVNLVPDLAVTKTNNAIPPTIVGTPWTWTITVESAGPSPVSFSAGQVMLRDDLPASGLTYGPVSGSLSGLSNGPFTCAIDVAFTLTCTATGPIVIFVGDTLTVSFTATPTAPGVYANPRPGGICQADPGPPAPNGVLAEANEANNTCSDSVTAIGVDLAVTKTNNVSGTTTVGTPWEMTITVTNLGALTATFTDDQVMLLDDIPDVNVTTGQIGFDGFGGTGLDASCVVAAFPTRILCQAEENGVTIPSGGGFRVTLPFTASAPGVYANPRTGGTCIADPNNVLAETSETNNVCADSVTVRGPDLTAVKTNDVSGSATVGVPFTWRVALRNGGPAPATFAGAQFVFTDFLPNGTITYGPVSATPVGSASPNLLCSIIAGPPQSILACTATASGVTIPTNGGYDLAFQATASAPGSFVNPTRGVCRIDPDNRVAEENETNNDCSNTVSTPAPDLAVAKTNNVSGVATVGVAWTWIVELTNTGTLPAAFANGQVVLADHLPTPNVAYGQPTVTPIGSPTGALTCAIDATATFGCTANGAVSIPPSGGFRVAFTALASASGTYANPRAGGVCRADPNNAVAELNEANNGCTDTVTASAAGAAAADLRVAKTNNVSGAAIQGVPWTWTLSGSNAGQSPATFASGQVILSDALPNGAVTYGAPVVSVTGGTTGTVTCAISALTLTCTAAGAPVTIPTGGGFQVVFTAVSTATGTFANPRVGGACLIDPNNVIAETNEANNACADTVVVGAQATVNDPNNDDEDDERRLSETQRHQRERTNASGQDDERTEGNVLEVRCNTAAPPQYEVSFPTHTPYIVIATMDGNQQLRLLYGTRSQCDSIRVGDYAEADGEKQHEYLFDVHNLTVRRR